MAWGSTKARVRGKIASGGFAKKPDYSDTFSTAANILAQGMLDAKERRLEADKEAKAKAEENAEKQAAKEKEAADRKRKAEALASRLGMNPQNTQAITYLTEQLYLFNDDTTEVFKLLENDRKAGRFKEVELPPIVEGVTSASMNQAPPVRLDSGVGGVKEMRDSGKVRPLTSFDLPNIADGITTYVNKEGDPVKSPELMSEAQQMMDAFGPQQLEKSEVTEAETKQFGIKVDPDAADLIELDFTRLTTLDDIDLYEGEIKSKGQTLTDAQQEVIKNRKDLLEGRRVDAAIADAVKDENNAKSALMALDAKVNQAATEEEKKIIKDSYEYKAISGFVERFALGDAYEVPVNQLKTAQDVQLEKAFIVMNNKNVSPEVLAKLDEMENAYLAKEARTDLDEQREIRRGFVTQETDTLQSIANLTTFDTYTEEEVNLAKEILESRTNADAADKLKEFKRDLVGKSKEELIQISKGAGFTLLEKVAARAYLAAFPENFDLTEYDDVETSTIETIIAAKGTDPNVVTQLEALVANRKIGQDALDPKSEDYLVTYLDKNGDKQVTTAKLAKDGSTYVDLSDPLNKITPAPNTNVVNLSQNDQLYDNVIKINQSLIKPLKEQRIAMQTALVSAKKLDDLVNPDMGGDPAILTTLGGTLPQVMERLGLETAALINLFDATGSTQTVFTAIDEAFSALPNVGEAAQKAALFNAEKLKLAFAFAAAQGQTGVGLSNKDFANALTIISSGKKYETFTMNIRSQMNQVIIKTEGMIQDFREDESVKLLAPFVQDRQLFEGYTQSAEQYAQTRGIGDAFAWAKGSTSTGPVISQQAIDFLKQNPNTRAEFDKKYGAGEAAKILGN